MSICQNIELDCGPHYYCGYCTFNSKNDELVLYSGGFIFIYSTQTKNNQWNCKRIYKTPENSDLINISKYDKLYLFSNNYISEWNLQTEKSTRLLFVMEFNEYDEVVKDIIFSKIFPKTDIHY